MVQKYGILDLEKKVQYSMELQEMISSPVFLRELAQAAISEMQTGTKQPRESHDVFLGKCWMKAMDRVLHKHNLKLAVEPK